MTTMSERYGQDQVFGFTANTGGVVKNHAAKLIAGGKIDEGSVAGAASIGAILDTNDGTGKQTTVGVLVGPARKKVVTGGAFSDLEPLAQTAAGKYALATAGQVVVAYGLEASGGADELRLVFLLPPSQYRIASANIAALTNNTAGAAADGTLEAIPSPADTPSTADALRDDLVANAIPAIRNNFTEIKATLDTILAVLDAQGLTL